jgi:Tfp pilus assembly protein PilN
VDRTIKFFNSNNPDKPVLSNVPVFVSGALADEPDLCQALSDDLGHPVFILASPLELPEGLDPNRYMVNIGLVLKQLATESGPAPLITNLNILPSPYRPEPISWPRIVTPPATAVAVGLLAFMVMVIQSASANVSQISGQLDTTTQLIQQKLQQSDDLKKKIAELEKKIASAEISGKNFTAAVERIVTLKDGLNGDLSLAVKELPGSVTLSSLGETQDAMTIKGWSPSEREILAYMDSLKKSDRFTAMTISALTKLESGGMNFSLTLATGGQD